MEVTYHPLVERDVLGILRYYHDISPRLAAEFQGELSAKVDNAAQNPLRFPPTAQGFRRANLKKFPYHFLYEPHPGSIRVMIVRHNKRHPRFGTGRE